VLISFFGLRFAVTAAKAFARPTKLFAGIAGASFSLALAVITARDAAKMSADTAWLEEHVRIVRAGKFISTG